jgi:hypothetical protein
MKLALILLAGALTLFLMIGCAAHPFRWAAEPQGAEGWENHFRAHPEECMPLDRAQCIQQDLGTDMCMALIYGCQAPK